MSANISGVARVGGCGGSDSVLRPAYKGGACIP